MPIPLSNFCVCLCIMMSNSMRQNHLKYKDQRMQFGIQTSRYCVSMCFELNMVDNRGVDLDETKDSDDLVDYKCFCNFFCFQIIMHAG